MKPFLLQSYASPRVLACSQFVLIKSISAASHCLRFVDFGKQQCSAAAPIVDDSALCGRRVKELVSPGSLANTFTSYLSFSFRYGLALCGQPFAYLIVPCLF